MGVWGATKVECPSCGPSGLFKMLWLILWRGENSQMRIESGVFSWRVWTAFGELEAMRGIRPVPSLHGVNVKVTEESPGPFRCCPHLWQKLNSHHTLICPHLSRCLHPAPCSTISPQPGRPQAWPPVPQLPSMLHQTTFLKQLWTWVGEAGGRVWPGSSKLPTAPQLEGLEWCRPLGHEFQSLASLVVQ